MGECISSQFDCCVSRSEGDRCCWREGQGIGPTDACLREAEFFDCSEGDQCHDILFEQARLKLEKGRLLANFAYDNLCSDGLHSSVSDEQPLVSEEGSSELGRGKWLGTSFQRLASSNKLDIKELARPSWCPGNGADLKVRANGFTKTRKKDFASNSLPYGSMYECICCDAIRADTKIENIVGRLVHVRNLPSTDAPLCEGESAAGHSICWTKECPLPRILCINLMLPYTTGSNDPGCSFVAFFRIKPEVLRDIQKGSPPACIRKFEEFCRGPTGKPDDVDDPNRKMNSRRNAKVKADSDPNLLKATAWCENASDLRLPGWMSSFNGKPVVITNSGYVVAESPGQGSPPGEWLEVGVDVRHFNWLARKALVGSRDRMRNAAIHFGFLVQAVDEATLPEGLICDMHVCRVDLDKDPIYIENSCF